MTCACCGAQHYAGETLKISDDLVLGQLPHSTYPWIAVMYGDVTIWANQEWSPFVMYPDGKLEAIEAHLPHECRG